MTNHFSAASAQRSIPTTYRSANISRTVFITKNKLASEILRRCHRQDERTAHPSLPEFSGYNPINFPSWHSSSGYDPNAYPGKCGHAVSRPLGQSRRRGPSPPGFLPGTTAPARVRPPHASVPSDGITPRRWRRRRTGCCTGRRRRRPWRAARRACPAPRWSRG